MSVANFKFRQFHKQLFNMKNCDQHRSVHFTLRGGEKVPGNWKVQANGEDTRPDHQWRGRPGPAGSSRPEKLSAARQPDDVPRWFGSLPVRRPGRQGVFQPGPVGRQTSRALVQRLYQGLIRTLEHPTPSSTFHGDKPVAILPAINVCSHKRRYVCLKPKASEPCASALVGGGSFQTSAVVALTALSVFVAFGLIALVVKSRRFGVGREYRLNKRVMFNQTF